MIVTCKEMNEDNYILEDESDKQYILPSFLFHSFDFNVGDRIAGKIRFNPKKKEDYFEPNHPNYKIGDVLEFKIVDFSARYNKNYIIVNDCFNNNVRVLALKWQNKDSFKFENLRCEVIDIVGGRPRLRNIDYRHPFYEVGNEYDFKFIGIEKKILRDGRPFDVIKLQGEDNCIHETPPLPSQYGHKFKPKKITCKVKEISAYLKLEQTNSIDPYFSEIENIVSAEKSVIKKFFWDLKERKECSELFKQYESSSSLWAITYCNKILPEQIISSANNFNFKEAITLTDLLLDVESWILKSGLIDSFKKEETKVQIKAKSERFIDRFRIMKFSFNCIASNKLDITALKTHREKVLALAYYLRYNKRELISYKRLFQLLIQVVKQNKEELIGQFETNYLCEYIEYQKGALIDDEQETDFTIGSIKKLPFDSEDDLFVFLKYTIIQAYLIDNHVKQSIYLSEFFKYLSFYFKSDLDKKQCLKNSYYIVNSNNCCIDFKFEYLDSIDDFEYLFSSFGTEIYELEERVDKNLWLDIIKDFKNESTITVRLKHKKPFGFIGEYKNVYCVLPNSSINSNVLKYYNEQECDILINTIIQDTYYNFSTIIVKELPTSHKEHKLENALIKSIEIGDVLNCTVKNITNFGVFLSSFAGEGLLHINNITELYIDSPLNSIFKKGEDIKAVVLEKQDGKDIAFGLKQLKNTPYESSLNEIEFRIYSPSLAGESPVNESNSINSELNKQIYIQGHLFEYFSMLQYDFEGKIKYLKLAKIYYSAIQSSRSYFLNTYIGYFKTILSLESTLAKKSLKELGETTKKSNELLSQLNKNTKSIEKFPSIYRLIFFLDILSSFNNSDDKTIEKLTEYLLQEKYTEYSNLNKIAKVVLSNNLIISEVEDEDFMFKNLRILYHYLKVGVFDVSENEQEKKERELKERISQIRNKVFKEESERVEFKSSLISPILDTPRQKSLLELQKRNDSKSKLQIDNLIGKVAKSRVIHSAMKTLVAFANSKGGTLFIGINDDGEFIGIEKDYDEIGQVSKDELGKRLDDYIKTYIGNSFFGLLSVEFEEIDNKDIIVVKVESSKDEVFILKDDKGSKCSDFYIRRHSSSVKLTGKELIEYYKWRFKTPAHHNVFSKKA
jgi:predicted RNA-binding protein with RPS1 domain